VLRYHEPGGRWILPPEVGWRLYDQYRSTPWAEEIAWFAAQGSLGGDECDAACIFDGLSRSYARYWEAFPNGRWIDEALTSASRRTVHARGTACMYGSPEATRASAARIRASLARVAAPRRDSILAHVAEVERGCRPGAG
jgi:hypothetical protein